MKRQISPLREFLHKESSSGFFLVLAACLGLVVANSPLSDKYFDLLAISFKIEAGFFYLSLSVLKIINYGLMTIFFFVVGLEIKRELVAGHLSSVKKAAMPFLAAIGGMAVPAAIYLVIAGGQGPEGWAIPVATDIALAVGLLAMMGPSVTLSLRSFLLALAVIDDIGAILIIALVYSTGITFSWLTAAFITILVIVLLGKTSVDSFLIYIVLGLLLWYSLYRTGVHPTLAGVILGLLTPHRVMPHADFEDSDDGSVSYVEYVEAKLHPVSSFVIVPLFAFVNTGVVITSESIRDYAASKARAADLPEGAAFNKVVATGSAAGIGFTVALFIADLAFDDAALQNIAVVAVIIASVISALISTAFFKLSRK